MKVSVIIPSYNDRLERLKTSIHSVLSQTFKDFELIVVDDGSELPFAGLEKEIYDKRITWLKLDKNIGPAAARNRGANISKGKYLAFLDTGDWWEPDKLSFQVRLLDNRGEHFSFVFCGARVYIQGCRPFSLLPTRPDDWIDALLTGQPITGSASAVVVWKELFEKVGGFYAEKEVPEDRDLWLRLALVADVGFVPEVLTNLFISFSSRSFNIEEKRKSYRYFIERHQALLAERGLLQKAKSYYHSSLANKMFYAGMCVDGLKETTKALRKSFEWEVLLRAICALAATISRIPYRVLVDMLRPYRRRF